MTVLRREDREALPPERSAAPMLDPGEARAVMIGAAIFIVFLYFIKFILLPFVLASIVAYICTPILDWAAKRTRLPRLLYAIALYLLFLAVAALLLTLTAKNLVAEARATAADLEALLDNLSRQVIGEQPVVIFGTPVDAHQITQSVLDRIRAWFGQGDQIAEAVGYGLVSMIGAFLAMVLLFYFLTGGPHIARGVFWIVPPRRRPLVAHIWKRLDPMLLRYFVGMLAVVAYATIAAYVGLGVVLGVRHAVLLALLTGVVEVVPVLGPTTAAVLAGLVSLRTATGIGNIVDYALYATVLRLSIDQLVGPIVLGRAAHVHPVLIIFCFLAGGVVLGVPGIILAVPMALAVKSTLATLYGDE